MTCGIYKIENIINGKIYIGQSIEIERRWQKHLSANDEFIIHKALKKYGKNNFIFSIIEECELLDLDEREQYWINYYQSKTPNGYNMIDGGNNGAGFAKGKRVEQYSLQGDYIASYNSAHEASRATQINYSSICACCRGEISHTKGYQWKYMEDEKNIIPIKQAIIQQRPILQYSLNGELIHEYATMHEAHILTGIAKPTISKVCNHKGRTAGGYFWCFKDDIERINDFLIESKKQNNKYKTKHIKGEK